MLQIRHAQAGFGGFAFDENLAYTNAKINSPFPKCNSAARSARRN